jgi:mono/diheme cytochrome c family protein
MKLTVKLILTLFVLICGITVVSADQKKGNEAKGRYYFKQTCKECHTKGAEGGEVTPISKIQSQWTRYFATGKHNKGTELLTKHLTAEQLRDVETFLVNHAADSPHPETCGK